MQWWALLVLINTENLYWVMIFMDQKFQFSKKLIIFAFLAIFLGQIFTFIFVRNFFLSIIASNQIKLPLLTSFLLHNHIFWLIGVVFLYSIFLYIKEVEPVVYMGIYVFFMISISILLQGCIILGFLFPLRLTKLL